MAIKRPPLIGITTYGKNDQGSYSLPSSYVESVRRAGGIPLLIAPGVIHADDIVNQIDGLILSGGGDLNPHIYNGKNHESNYMIDPQRDDTEFDLSKIILRKKIRRWRFAVEYRLLTPFWAALYLSIFQIILGEKFCIDDRQEIRSVIWLPSMEILIYLKLYKNLKLKSLPGIINRLINWQMVSASLHNLPMVLLKRLSLKEIIGLLEYIGIRNCLLRVILINK